jgi:hypothetical protein
MTPSPMQRFWAKALGCYLCWSIAGLCLAVIAANMEASVAKSVVVVLAAILFFAGGLAVAIDRDRVRRQREHDEKQ